MIRSDVNVGANERHDIRVAPISRSRIARIMPSVFDGDARAALARRVRQLRPDAQRQWGAMTSGQVVAHLVDALKMAFDELPVAAKKTPLRYTPIKQLIIHVAPFPKGAPTAPELVSRVAADFAGEVESLETLLHRCGDAGQRFAAEHPAFGRLTRRDWGVLIYRHTDHHLRQFGV
jgi:hypothetical protein